MPKYALKRKIDALETEISQVDSETRREMIARLERLVLALDVGRVAPRREAARRTTSSQYESIEDSFDNMPI